MTQTNYIERYWRDAKPEDAIKEPPMVARFRDKDAEKWLYESLLGWDRTDPWRWSGPAKNFWKQCQVYDAPDPGEGWRLIDTENEKGEVGDEFLTQSGVWLPECRHNGFEHGVPYRRRIEPPKPKYVPFEWQDREQLRGRWLQRKTDHVTDELMATKFETGRRGLVVNGVYSADLLLKQWTFDTGEPVGKRVE